MELEPLKEGQTLANAIYEEDNPENNQVRLKERKKKKSYNERTLKRIGSSISRLALYWRGGSLVEVNIYLG